MSNGGRVKTWDMFNIDQPALRAERIITGAEIQACLRKRIRPVSHPDPMQRQAAPMATLDRPDIAASPSENRGELARSETIMVTGAKPPFRLLVVDDEPDIREVTSAMLAEEGYEVLTAEDGQEALELLPQFRPDLVITDLRMPRLSGFELLEIMRERFPCLPVIAVSGEFSDDEMPPNVRADAFVSKGWSYIAPLAIKIKELLWTAAMSRHPKTGSDGVSE